MSLLCCNETHNKHWIVDQMLIKNVILLLGPEESTMKTQDPSLGLESKADFIF